MEISRKEGITGEGEVEALWVFYQDNLGVLNEDTPIMQTFPRDDFEAMMSRGDVIKYIAYLDGAVIGLGVITTDLELDPLISAAFFAKHYPGDVVYHIPILCVASGRRAGAVGIGLIKGVTSEVCQNGLVVYFSSESAAPRMQASEMINRIVRMGTSPDVGGVVDREICSLYRRGSTTLAQRAEPET